MYACGAGDHNLMAVINKKIAVPMEFSNIEDKNVTQVALAPDASNLAFVSNDKGTKIKFFNERKLIKGDSLELGNEIIQELEFENNTFLLAGTKSGRILRIQKSPASIQSEVDVNGELSGFVYDSNNNKLYVLIGTNLIKVYNPKNMFLLETHELSSGTSSDPFFDVNFNGNFLVLGNGKTLIRYDLNTKKVTDSFETTNNITSVFAGDGLTYIGCENSMEIVNYGEKIIIPIYGSSTGITYSKARIIKGNEYEKFYYITSSRALISSEFDEYWRFAKEL